VLLTVPSTLAVADQTYYRWTDDSGNLVMSDRPPERPDIAYETIATQGSSLRRPRARPAPDPSVAGTASGSASAQPSSGPAPRPAPQVAAAERDPELCKQARENLQILEIKPRIRAYNDQGELEYLTPEEIEEEKRRTRLTIETHCEG
jgi:predicted O-methyltransferase YrrM